VPRDDSVVRPDRNPKLQQLHRGAAAAGMEVIERPQVLRREIN
jgi:hypothetical protein